MTEIESGHWTKNETGVALQCWVWVWDELITWGFCQLRLSSKTN